jgi:hypothetical protein
MGHSVLPRLGERRGSVHRGVKCSLPPPPSFFFILSFSPLPPTADASKQNIERTVLWSQGRFELAAALNLLLWLSLGTNKAHAHLPRHVHIWSAEQDRAEQSIGRTRRAKNVISHHLAMSSTQKLSMWHLESYIMNEHWEESSRELGTMGRVLFEEWPMIRVMCS